MVYPSYEEAVQIIKGGDYKRIPLKIELCADMITPLMAIRRLKKVSRHVFCLKVRRQIRNGEDTRLWALIRHLSSHARTA